MTMPPSLSVAVDVGNSRTKLGLFDRRFPQDGALLPEPTGTISVANEDTVSEGLGNWLAGFESGKLSWSIGSVNRPAATRLIDWLYRHRPDEPITLLAAGDLPLDVRLDRPDMVGIDRLLDAVAANRLRRPGHQAVLVDVGSAITVDLVSSEGEFLGGAILPGLAMSAQCSTLSRISCRKSRLRNSARLRPLWARRRFPRCNRACFGAPSARFAN